MATAGLLVVAMTAKLTEELCLNVVELYSEESEGNRGAGTGMALVRKE